MPTPLSLTLNSQLSPHRYGSRLALSNVNFEVKAGEIFGLLGPNGGGKSTLFRILSTMMVPTGGRAQGHLYGICGQKSLMDWGSVSTETRWQCGRSPARGRVVRVVAVVAGESG